MTIAIRLGSIAQDVDTGLKHLWSFVSVVGYYDTVRNQDGTPYQVPADIEFIATKIMFMVDTANGEIELGVGDTSAPNQAAPPTNYSTVTARFRGPVAWVTYEFDVYLRFSTTKYPVIRSTGPLFYLHFLGYERSV